MHRVRAHKNIQGEATKQCPNISGFAKICIFSDFQQWWFFAHNFLQNYPNVIYFGVLKNSGYLFATGWAQEYQEFVEKCLRYWSQKLTTIIIQSAEIEPFCASPEISYQLFSCFFVPTVPK